MTNQDEFTLWLAKAFIDSKQEPVQSSLLEAMEKEARVGDDLDTQLKRAKTSEKQAGAFGLELAGALLLPVVIELGKQLWKTYSEELMKKLGADLAELTANKVKKWFTDQLALEHDKVVKQMETNIRRVGETHNLSQTQVEELIAIVRQGHVENRLRYE